MNIYDCKPQNPLDVMNCLIKSKVIKTQFYTDKTFEFPKIHSFFRPRVLISLRSQVVLMSS